MSRICAQPIAFVLRGILFLLLGLAVSGIWAAGKQDQPKEIKPVEARKHIGESVRVTFVVKKTKDSPKTQRVYLDSEIDYRDTRNLGVLIEESAKAKFKDAGIAEPHVHYKDKTIRVTGKPFIEDGLVFIKADSPTQIEIVEKK